MQRVEVLGTASNPVILQPVRNILHGLVASNVLVLVVHNRPNLHNGDVREVHVLVDVQIDGVLRQPSNSGKYLVSSFFTPSSRPFCCFLYDAIKKSSSNFDELMKATRRNANSIGRDHFAGLHGLLLGGVLAADLFLDSLVVSVSASASTRGASAVKSSSSSGAGSSRVSAAGSG